MRRSQNSEEEDSGVSGGLVFHKSATPSGSVAGSLSISKAGEAPTLPQWVNKELPTAPRRRGKVGTDN